MMAFKDAGHLFRFAGIFVVLFLIFLAVRGFVVPKTFGEYGHYRAAAIGEIAALPLHFAGHQACAECHADIVATKAAGMHAHVSCEACHGALENHVENPAAVVPVKLNTATLCVRCHEASAARPQGFPQVVAAEHANGVACETCHNPHSPAIGSGSDADAAGGAK